MAEADKTSKTVTPKLKKNDLKFTVRSGERTTDTAVQEQTYYFELNKDNLPIKVGDGTYGTVFRVLDASDIRYAVKILYNASATDLGQAKSDIVRQRFEYEAQAIEDIRNHLPNEDAFRDIPIIQPKGWTEKFHEPDAYKILTKHNVFEKFGLDVSQFAMVTKLYDGTLKDLLEGGSPLKNESDNKPRLSGYEVLSNLDFETRFSTIKYFLSKIAEGLVALHKAHKWHLDLKPANIYYVCSSNSFDVVIGDLGFIGQPQLAGTATSADEIALGTRHYRSPEQKDFSDCCEVDVELNHSSKQGGASYKVIVSDPKFADTIIESGDAMIFSKDIKRTEYLIDQIKWDENKLKAEISFKTDDSKMKVDRNTQVVFYKHQSTRTDIFGFGALLYDMITCGRSPERFYDYLRMDDSTNKGIASIREKYRQVSTYSAQDPNYVNTFSTFRHKNGQDYAPLEIVELILECMLYQAKGTLFESEVDPHDQNASTHWKAMNAALIRLNELEKIYPSFYILEHNPLFRPPEKQAKSTLGSSLQDELILLQNMGTTELSYRLGRGAIQIRKLINLVQKETRDQDFFLAEMTPENINLEQDTTEKTGFSIITYQNFAEYQEDLLKDIVYTKVFYNPLNPYSHESLGHLRRKITLSACLDNDYTTSDESDKKEDSMNNTWSFKFIDSSPFGDVVYKDDWIVFTNGEHNQLYQVTESNKDSVIKTKFIKAGDNVKAPLEITDDNQVAVYYRNINTTDNYLASLGIYLYQAFFVGFSDNSISTPMVIQRHKIFYQNSPKQLKKAHLRLRNTLDKPIFRKEQKNIKINMAESLFRRIAALYIVLALPHPSQFFTDNGSTTSSEDREKILEKLSGYWFLISNDMDKYLGLTPGYLSIPDNITSLKNKNLNILESAEITNHFNIDNYCNEILQEQVSLSSLCNLISGH